MQYDRHREEDTENDKEMRPCHEHRFFEQFEASFRQTALFDEGRNDKIACDRALTEARHQCS
jgi:hypothetical protein